MSNQYSDIEISYVIPAYVQNKDNRDVANLLDTYASYSKEVRQKIQFIIVDDGSPIPIEVNNPKLNILLARVTEDIKWNQPGARNLGVHLARSSKLILTDLDHTFPESVLKDLIRYPIPTSIWKFRRKRNGAKVKAHPNTFFISKATYFKTLGVDEEFSGNYGHDDIYFYMLQRHLGTRFRKYRKTFITAIEHEHHNLSRDASHNQELLDRKVAAMKQKRPFEAHSRLFLNFNWEKVAETWLNH